MGILGNSGLRNHDENESLFVGNRFPILAAVQPVYTAPHPPRIETMGIGKYEHLVL